MSSWGHEVQPGIQKLKEQKLGFRVPDQMIRPQNDNREDYEVLAMP